MVKSKSRRRRPARPRSRSRPAARATAAGGAAARAETGEPPTPGFIVVGVGASAGGLEAFSELLQAMPRHPGLTLVLVQHLAPNHESALPALLAVHTEMPVIQVTSGVKIEPDSVYVIPPNVQMEIIDGTLELSPRPGDRTQYTPIDTFFSSLARVAQARAIAVVLSGTASDGAVGIRDVKAAGGITFVQKPESARYDGMPKAALGTGMVDLVLTPSEIGAELVQIAAHPFVRSPALTRDDGAVRDDQLKKIFDLLRPISGVDFRHYKLPTIRRRLLRRMALQRVTDVDQYVRMLQTNSAELRGLFQDLLIHVTRFFREPDSFAALAETVFPKLIEERSPDQPIRMWVCGCATGEEAYSLAIALVEFLQRHQSDLRVQIFATDVSETAIDHARAGVYSASIASDVGAERLRRFFTRSDGHYRVSKLIRDLCVFARQDLSRDPPFSRLDLVMCRNVLIYMDTPLQTKLIRLFHYALNPHGYLVLGQAETVGAQAGLFGLIDKKHRIHRKKSAPIMLPSVTMPLEYAGDAVAPKRGAELAAGDKGLQLEINRIILDRYAPAGVVVGADLQIVQFRGQTGRFLEPAPGDASLSLLKMAREGLLYGLRTSLHAARKTKQPVRKEGLQVRTGHTWKPVSIEVVPITVLGRLHYLVLFEEGREPDAGPAPKAKGKGGKKGRVNVGEMTKVTLLQRELAASRDYLQSIIQELEASNQELQSANEEILSSNEELQSTNEELDTAKEELQSTNEELNTVNEELHSRNEELSRVNSDLVNLVGSVQIAIVIVSTDLRIRRYTPMAEKVLNLIPADLDRSIGHINPNIDVPNLEQLIIECMDTVAPVEREVHDRQGRRYALRIRPYKNMDNKIDGAVLALIDIDTLKRSEQTTARWRELAEALLRRTSQPLAVLSSELQIIHVNAPFASLFSRSPEELTGRRLPELTGPAWSQQNWRAWDHRPVGAVLPPMAIVGESGEPARLVMQGFVMPAPDSDSTVVLVSITDDAAGDQERNQDPAASD